MIGNKFVCKTDCLTIRNKSVNRKSYFFITIKSFKVENYRKNKGYNNSPATING